MHKLLPILALAVLPLAASATDCTPRLREKLICTKGSNGVVAAKLCTNERNGLAWEWIFLSAQRAREYCGDQQSQAETPLLHFVSDAQENIPALESQGNAARATAAHYGITFEELLRQRKAAVVGNTRDGRPIYEYQSVGRKIRLI